MTPPVIQRFMTLLLVLASLAACAQDASPQKRSAATHTSSTAKVDDSAAGSIDLGAGASYTPAPLDGIGAIAGTLKIVDSAALGDSAAAGVPDCVPKPHRGAASAKNFGNTLVWISDVKRGKPFPIEKRTEVTSEDCLLDPRVQAVVVGTTVNVFNDDKLLHRLVFTRLGTHDTLTVMPFFNTGQVVASERLAKIPGVVEIRCVQHPWTRGYIAVFDHPYFAVTDDDGSFKIDSVPPGNYKIMIWHEGAAKPLEQQVQVAAGGTASIAASASPRPTTTAERH